MSLFTLGLYWLFVARAELVAEQRIRIPTMTVALYRDDHESVATYANLWQRFVGAALDPVQSRKDAASAS